MVYLSIIIPAFNSEKTLPALFKSIKDEKPKETEVIVVDDASTDDTKKVTAMQYKRYKNYNDYKYYKLNKNRGPAFARNYGVKRAKGKVILFLDADVVVQPGTIKEVIKIFREDKYRVAATGVWDKKQNSNKFFPKFKALRDWSYWINEKKADSYYYLFSTRIAAIRRDVFLALGGFKENYSGADVEDIEFTYRLAQKYRVDFNPKMRVHHEFEGFFPIAKKYFKRAYQWVEIYQNRKKFDPVATTSNEAITTLSAVGIVGGLILLTIATSILNFKFEIFNQFEMINFQTFFLILCFLFLAIHLWGVRKFLWFVFKEEGIIFAVKSFFVGIVLYLFIFSGAAWGAVRGNISKR